MQSIGRLLKVLGIILFVVGALVYFYGFLGLQGSKEVGIDYSGIGKLSLVVGFVLVVASTATRADTAGHLARTMGIQLLGILFSFFFLISAWGLYALGYGFSLYSIILFVAGLYLLLRVVWSLRGKN